MSVISVSSLFSSAAQICNSMRESSYKGSFSYGPGQVGLYTYRQELFEWLNRSFSNYFLLKLGDRTTLNLFESQNNDLFFKLNAQAKKSLIDKGTFSEILVEGENAIFMQSEGERQVFFVLNKVEKRIIIVSKEEDSLNYWIFVMRAIRALLKYLLIINGGIPFHSASCELNGTGICIIGDKFAGKTSTLVNLLTMSNAKIVSNDKGLITADDHGLKFWGMPNKVGIRLGTILTQPKIQRWLKDDPTTFYWNEDWEYIKQSLTQPVSENIIHEARKLRLTPAELADLCNTSIQVSIQPKVFIIPIFDPKITKSQLLPVTEKKIDILVSNYLSLKLEPQSFFSHLFHEMRDEDLKKSLFRYFEEQDLNYQVYYLYQNQRTNHSSFALLENLSKQING